MNDENEDIEIVSHSTDAEWNPPQNITQQSNSTKILYDMKKGQTLRVVHHDVKCTCGGGSSDASCSLSGAVSKLRKKGWKIEYYHEEPGVAVFRRTK